MQLWLMQQENTGIDELGDDMAERVLCSSLGCCTQDSAILCMVPALPGVSLATLNKSY